MVSKLKNEYFLELVGYCLEDGNRMLAYQFATMGSLHNILHGACRSLALCCDRDKHLERFTDLIQPLTVVQGRKEFRVPNPARS